MIQRHISNRRVRIVVGLVLAGGLLTQCHRALLARTATQPMAIADLSSHKPGPHEVFAAPAPALAETDMPT